MALVALILSLGIACLGALGVASPDRLLAVVSRFQTPAGIYIATAIRLVLGFALYMAAPASRAPEPMRVVGIVIMVAGLITPLFGLERFRRLLDWWASRSSGFIRIWAVFAMGFGLLLAYGLVK
jgi:hypothetical protein